MAKPESIRPKVEIITPEQRILDDPRGLQRVTIIGDLIFRKVFEPVIEIPEEVN